MRIREELLDIIDSPKLTSKLMEATGKSYPTIRLWMTRNDIQLTQKRCLDVITNHTGMAEKELFDV